MSKPLSAAALLLLLARPALALDVSSCETVVPPGEEAHLVGDLVCSSGATGVVLGPRATLHLDGRSIEGGSVGVDCTTCTVLGPGEIRGQSLVGIGGRRVTVEGVTVHSASGGVANGIGARVLTVRDSVVRDCAGIGISAKKLVATNVDVLRSGLHGIQTNTLDGTDLLVEDNGERGITTLGPLDLTQAVVRRNSVGIWSQRGSVTITDSEIVQSGEAPSYDQNPDLIARRAPVVANTVCGRSQIGTTLGTWGVCTND